MPELIISMMRKIFSAILLFITISSGAQVDFTGDIYHDVIGSEKISSVRLFREEWNLSYPILKKNSNDKLMLHFDLLGDQPESYDYTFVHCDKDWKKSDVFVNDYIEGFEENPVEQYEASFNTTVGYYHYSLTFPNDRIKLKLSGNYAILVYRPGERDKPVLIRRFVIAEDGVKININAHRPLMAKSSNTHQQIDFNVTVSATGISDPYRDVYATILQNGRWDNARANLKPDFYGGNELKYSSLSDRNIFPGGNEFRYFDIKSIRYQSEYVRSVDFSAPNYNVYLQPSENREFKPYFYWKDFNGKYFIAFQEGRDPEKDADYVYVYFTLPSREMLEGGKMYVSGGFNNWKLDKRNVMTYNTALRQYECTILLKQGWYNYEYVFLKSGETDAAAGPFEGSHYETENDYTVLIYYRNPRERYDRLMGTATINTLNNISD